MANPCLGPVLQRIDELKLNYAQLSFFEFLRDETIDAEDRIAFVPYVAYVILSFEDLHTYILQKEPTHDACADRVNAHVYDDDHQWSWYLEDLHTLGFNKITAPSGEMKLLWSGATCANRILMYRLTAMINRANRTERMAIVEAIAGAENVLFQAFIRIARILGERIGNVLHYSGSHHVHLESEPGVGSDHRGRAAMEVDQAAYDRCLCFVDEVFEVFAQWAQELLRFAASHKNALPRPMLHSSNLADSHLVH